MATLRASGSADALHPHPAPGRILYVITDLEVGGVPLHLLRLATSMRANGWHVAVVSLKPPGPVGEQLRGAGAEVLSCQAVTPWDWRAIERLAGMIGDFAPDVVHSLLFHANLAARLAALLSGFPRSRVLCEIQTVEIERTWHLWVDRLTHRLCRFTIGNSPSVIEHLHSRAGIPCSRLRCLPGGVDLTRFADVAPIPRGELRVPENVPLLLWVGRMDPIKGLDTLIAAVDLLQRSQPVHLLLAGDGPLRPTVEADVRRRGLADRVHLLGVRSDVPRLLAAADLFVFPSRTEGFPNAVLEAQAARVPVVATDAPGNRDLITDSQTGRLVPIDNPAALATAVEHALANPDTARQSAASAREIVEREYTLTACHQRYIDLYAETRNQRTQDAH